MCERGCIKKMINKKILMSLMVLSLFAVMPMIMADTNLTVTIQGINACVDITPDALDFGSIMPPVTNIAESTGKVVTFTPCQSNNQNLKIDTVVTGEPFASGLKFDGALANENSYTITCVDNGSGSCSYTARTLIPTLDVASVLTAGQKTGVVKYTITATSP